MPHFAKLADLAARVGSEVAVSDWLRIEQSRIDQFAQATGDLAWIHTDPARAAQGPFGKTVAHGFLTLSLIPHLAEQAMTIGDVVAGINYGLNRVRFTAPVPVDSRLRGRFTLKSFDVTPAGGGLPGSAGGAQAVWDIALEREDTGKPACVAEFIVRYAT